MISANVKIPQSLLNRLTKTWVDNSASDLVDATATNMLWNIQEYGFGSAGQNTPSGGAPIWQGRIWEDGHYRGYLSESHYIKKINPFNAQIVTPADFVEGVIEGYSTNWFYHDGIPVVFPPNPYHKRVVDKTIKDGTIPVIWKNIVVR